MGLSRELSVVATSRFVVSPFPRLKSGLLLAKSRTTPLMNSVCATPGLKVKRQVTPGDWSLASSPT